MIKLPRIRKDNVRTNLKDYNAGNNFNLNDPDFDDIDLFFDEDHQAKYMNDKMMQLEYKQEHQERKRRLWICLLIFGIVVGVLAITFWTAFYFNIYGFREFVLFSWRWVAHEIYEFFRNKDELYDEEEY